MPLINSKMQMELLKWKENKKHRLIVRPGQSTQLINKTRPTTVSSVGFKEELLKPSMFSMQLGIMFLPLHSTLEENQPCTAPQESMSKLLIWRTTRGYRQFSQESTSLWATMVVIITMLQRDQALQEDILMFQIILSLVQLETTRLDMPRRSSTRQKITSSSEQPARIQSSHRK